MIKSYFRPGPVLSLLIAAAIGASMAPAVRVVAKEIQSVLVTNTSASPVPATIVGTPAVSIAGTPTVNLAGTPSVGIVGTPAVSIAGTPTVTLAGNGDEPVQGSIVLTPTDKIACADFYTVPAGKRLVVEYVNVEAFGLTPTNRVAVRLGATGATSAVSVPITPAFGGTHVGSEMVRLFSTTDLSACAFFQEAQGAFEASAAVRFAGHLTAM